MGLQEIKKVEMLFEIKNLSTGYNFDPKSKKSFFHLHIFSDLQIISFSFSNLSG